MPSNIKMSTASVSVFKITTVVCARLMTFIGFGL